MSQILYSSTTETSSGNDSKSINLVDKIPRGLKSEVLVQLDVTAASGTSPTLVVVIQESLDGVNWYTLMTFAQKTSPGTELLKAANPGKFIRAKWTIGGGTPSFTFGLDFSER